MCWGFCYFDVGYVWWCVYCDIMGWCGYCRSGDLVVESVVFFVVEGWFGNVGCGLILWSVGIEMCVFGIGVVGRFGGGIKGGRVCKVLV